MRASLENYISQSVILQYTLPNGTLRIPKSCYSTLADRCYACDDDALKMLIYNSIVDYAFNDNEWGDTTIEEMSVEALDSRMRFEDRDDEITQLRYGFYGEVLLNIILQRMWNTRAIIAKGIFYDPTGRSEEFKGYDSYHLLLHDDGQISLWFGEVKFYQSYTGALDSVFSNIEKALSNDYFRRNMKAILTKKCALNVQNHMFNSILTDFRRNPNVSIAGLKDKYGIRLVYPIFILSQETNSYDDTIRGIINYIQTKHSGKHFDLDLDFDLFFILLPLKDVKDIKKTVLSWIKTKQPITL